MITNYFLFLMTLISAMVKAETIEMTSPKSGWRDSSNKKIGFIQTVNYPDVKVQTPENQPDSGLIEGKIKDAINHHGKPYTLVVNGNAMPLLVNDGKFSRPYSFGAGTNNVAILSPDRKATYEMQFTDVSKKAFPARIRVILGWDSDGTDLDLHVITPSGQHCFYGNRLLKNGSALDVDVTTGFGPEIFASPGTERGPYLIYVNYYGRGTNQDITLTTVHITTNEGTGDEKNETFRVPLRNPGELTFIHSFIY